MLTHGERGLLGVLSETALFLRPNVQAYQMAVSLEKRDLVKIQNHGIETKMVSITKKGREMLADQETDEA